MTFTGFGEDLPLFFEGLEADNSKSYWSDHRAVYEEQVREPMTALLADLAAEFGEAKVFRPYRDVRFSKDKSPYKTHTGAHTHGRRGGAGALYVQVSADGLMVAGGCWTMERDQLARYRAAVLDDGTGRALSRTVSSLREDGWEPGAHDRLTRAPRGVDPDHPRVELLRLKGMGLFREHDVEPWLFTAGAREVVADAWRSLAPLNRWLDRHVGPHVPEATDRDEARRR